MKILLVQPPWRYSDNTVYLNEPLALEYIAAGILNDHDVKIIDLRLKSDFIKELMEFDPDVVAISSYTANINASVRLCNEAKQFKKSLYTIIGGKHVTISPDSVVDKDVDFIIVGEGVYPFKRLMQELDMKKNSFWDIPGLIYKDQNGNSIKNPRMMHPDLEQMPLPARQLIDPKNYVDWDTRADGSLQEQSLVIVTKGCPFRCTFCSMWNNAEGRYLVRDPQNVVDEFKMASERIFFADDESMINKEYIFKLCDKIEENGLKKKLGMYGRCDTISKSPDLVKRLKEVGMDRVVIGLESFSDEGLKKINKGNKLADQARAIEILRKNNIEIRSTFIVDTEFDEKDFSNLEKYILENGLQNTAEISVITPLPGTEFFRKNLNRIVTKNFDLFDFLHAVLPTKLPLKEFYQYYGRLWMNTWPGFRNHPSIKKIIRHYEDHLSDEESKVYPTIIC